MHRMDVSWAPKQRSQSGVRVLAPLLAVIGFGITLPGCSWASAVAHQASTYSCPEHKRLVTLDELDVSGLARSRSILWPRLDILQHDAEDTAYCQGRFTATAYSSSVGASTVLYDAILSPPGATQIARNREIPGLVQHLMATVRSNLQHAMVSLPSNSSDLTAAFLLATDHVALFGRGAAVRITMLTDGITTVGPTQINRPGLTPPEAIAAADLAPPANLGGAHVLIEGIGTVAGPAQPPSDYVAAVRAYATELCRRSHASSCLVTTEVAD